MSEFCSYFKKSTYGNYCLGANGNRNCTCDGNPDKCCFKLCNSRENKYIINEEKKSNFGDFFWNDMWLCFPSYIFKIMQKKSVTFEEFKKMLDGYIHSRKLIFKTSCDNSNYYIVRNNIRFCFGIYSGNFSLWDETGMRSLGHYNINNNEIPSDQFIDWIEQVTKNFCDGLVPCSDCKKIIPKEKIAGHYFAGIYCDDCWNHHGWKEKEANETYD